MGLMQKILDMLPGKKARDAKTDQQTADLKDANDRAKKVLG
jgi:signal recognition particle GTPase